MPRFFGKSRSQKRADNNLGVVRIEGKSSKKCRTPELEMIDRYLTGKQYDHLTKWEDCECSDEYIPIRKRKPRMIYPFLRILRDRVSAKLLGKSVFPALHIEDSEADEEFLETVMEATHFRSRFLQATKAMISHGSSFIRFKLDEGQIVIQHYNPKWCYPVFDAGSNLESLKIQYVFEDPNDLDHRGKPKEKWYRLDLGKDTDTLYDTPDYQNNVEPQFTVVNSATHGLGFVQGTWLRTNEQEHTPDGQAIADEQVRSFFDSMNYTLSQSDRAVSYGMDPQLMISGMDEDELDTLIKSAAKAWNLGKDGTAQFAEVQGSGVQRGEEWRASLTKDVMDITRVIFLDPEKMVGNAQSAKAMEVLHGPMVEMIDELRPATEKGMIDFLQKIMVALVIFNQRGEEVPIQMPPGYKPTSLGLKATWPPVFPLTIQDLQALAQVGATIANANIASRATTLKWLMDKGVDLPVEDIEVETKLVNTQPQFGGFF